MSEQQVQEQQQDSSKELKKFESNKKSLIAILGGDEWLKRGVKVGMEAMAEVMEELTKEKREQGKADIKKDILALIDSSINFDKFVKEEKAKMEKAIGEKHKEFNKQSEAIFKKIQDLKELVDTYYSALQRTSTPAPETGASEGTQTA